MSSGRANSMDPPQELIDGIEDVGHAMALAGIVQGEPGEDDFPGTLANSFLDRLGLSMESHYAMLTIHDEKDIKDELQDWEVSGADGTVRKATLGERGLALFTDRYCRLRAGSLTPSGPGPSTETSTQAQAHVAELQVIRQEVAQAVQVATAASYAVAAQTAQQAIAQTAQQAQIPVPVGPPEVSLKDTVSQVS